LLLDEEKGGDEPPFLLADLPITSPIVWIDKMPSIYTD
jgi:hypothetical protein